MEEKKNNQTESDLREVQKEDEISLIDLFAVLLRYKVMIICITVFSAVFAVGLSIVSLLLPPEKSFLPNKYTPQAQMLINDETSSSGLSSALSASGLSSFASLAGVSTGSSYSALASYMVHSNSFMDQIVDKFNLIERYKIEKHPRASSREALREVLTSDFDSDTGVFTIRFTDIDPVFAQEVVNFAVSILEQRFIEMGIDKDKLTKQNLEKNIEASYNEILTLQKQIQDLEYSVSNVYSSSGATPIMQDTTMIKMELKVQEEVYAQLKAQYEMLKVTMASEQPVFQILEYAEVPDRKSKPSRGMLCIIVTFAGGFISIFLAFLLNAIKNIKADPEAMAKLKGNKNEENS